MNADGAPTWNRRSEQDFVRWCTARPATFEPDKYFDVVAPRHHGTFLPWPKFLAREDASRATTRVRVIAQRLLRDVTRLARTAAISDADGLEACERLNATDASGRSLLARGEFLEGRCVELAVTGALGLGAAWFVEVIANAQRGVAELAPYFEGLAPKRPEVSHPARGLMAHVLRFARPGGVIVGLGRALGSDYFTPENAALTESVMNAFLLQLGGHARVVVRPPESLSFRDGALWVDEQQRVDVVLDAQFPVSNDPKVPRPTVPPDIMAAVRTTSSTWLLGPAARVLSDQRLFAAIATEIDERQDDPLRGHIAWTRLARRHRTRFRNADVDMAELLDGSRQDLVLKTSAACNRVLAGRGMSAGSWDAAVREALAAGDWVVQEAVEPTCEPYLDRTGHLQEGWTLWSALAFGDGAPHAMARVGQRGTIPLTYGPSPINPLDNAVTILVDD